MRYLLVLLMLFTTSARAFEIDPVAALIDDKTCLKLNMYHESRGEKMRGMIEVMKVTLARTMNPEFPRSVCDVVWQQKPVPQFSWTADSILDNDIHDRKAWFQIDKLVELYYSGNLHIKIDPEITYYHAGPITRFFRKLEFVKRIGRHSFYRE
jgi:spore germination cell wall hydrolase CwlJ-like protein